MEDLYLLVVAARGMFDLDGALSALGLSCATCASIETNGPSWVDGALFASSMIFPCDFRLNASSFPVFPSDEAQRTEKCGELAVMCLVASIFHQVVKHQRLLVL